MILNKIGSKNKIKLGISQSQETGVVFSMVLMHPVSPVHTAWLGRYGRQTDTSAVGTSYTRSELFQWKGNIQAT